MTSVLSGSLAAAALLTVVLLGGSVSALEEQKDEKDKIKACELKLCTLVTKKGPAAGDFTCKLAKTWAKEQIKQGSSAGRMSWGFGDARCHIDLKVAQATIVQAVSPGDVTLQLPEHTIHCDVEQDKVVKPAQFRAAPKIQFKDGQAKKVWVNLKEATGPDNVTSFVKFMAKLEDSIGIFHGKMIKGINQFLAEKCPTVVSGG